jgi:hypothetical protein
MSSQTSNFGSLNEFSSGIKFIRDIRSRQMELFDIILWKSFKITQCDCFFRKNILCLEAKSAKLVK